MTFAEPYWLLVGVAVCLFLVWRFRRYDRRQHQALTGFVAPHLAQELTRSVSRNRRILKRVFYVAGVVFLFVALARPRAGYRWEVSHRKGLDILFAVDTSKSMLAEDVKPNRLGRARLAVEDLLNKLDGDSVGLIAFAGNAFLQCPLTLDDDAFRDSLDALDTRIIPRGGTDIASAILEAQSAFKDRTDSDRILVLLSDGEDLSGDAITAAGKAAGQGITIFTVGVGTPSGELIPVNDAQGGTEFLKGPSGQFVKSRLDETTMRKIAEVTGGMYEPLGQQSQGLMAIYNEGLASFHRHDLAARRHRVHLERFEWPLGLALLCLVADWMIGTRRKNLLRKAGSGASGRSLVWSGPQTATAVGLLLAFFGLPCAAQASSQSAEKAYLKGDFAKAQSDYAATAARKPTDARLQFNLGVADYMSHDYARAEKAFKTTLKADEVSVQQNAYYSLGNTRYRLGQQTEQTDPQKTIQVWQEAVKSYDAALQIDPKDEDARFNRDLVKRKLERLQQRQQQPQKQQDQSERQAQTRKQNQNRNQSQPDQQKQLTEQANAGQQRQKNQPQTAPQHKDTDQAKATEAAKHSPPQEPATLPRDQQQADRGDSTPQPATGHSTDRKPEAQTLAAAHRQPGEMSREEARHLLNSLRNEERHLPPVASFQSSGNGREQQPLKDW